MVFLSRVGRVICRKIRSSLRSNVRQYETEPGGESIKSTTVSLLSQEDDDYLYVEAYSPVGFRLTNGFRIIGPCVLFPRSILHWGVGGCHELNEQSLSLFPLLEPKLDILILGVGDHGAKYDKSIVKFLRSNKINVEILPTDQACSTFNFLNSERRIVAAGLIPPTYMFDEYDEDRSIRTQVDAHGDKFFEMKHSFGEDAPDDTPGEFTPELKYLRENVYSKMGFGNEKKSGEKSGETETNKDSDSPSSKKET